MSQMIGPLLYENSTVVGESLRNIIFLEPTDSTDLTPEMISSAIGTFFKAKYDNKQVLENF